MKKMTFILACLTMAALSANAQMSKVILQHQGNVTMYEPDDIQTAITAAQDGDSVLLNTGEFPGFTIDRIISVIGAGTGTKITSNIAIAIPNKPTLTANILEGLNVKDYVSISINKPVNGLKIKKCTFYSISFSGIVNNVLIDRCKINKGGVILSEYVESLDIKNSQVDHVEGDTKTNEPVVKCINCYLDGNPVSPRTGNKYYSSNSAINFINSWINNYYQFTIGSNVNTQQTYHNYYSSKSKYLNCIVKNQTYGTYDTCWSVYDNDLHSRDIDLLIKDGYVGTDGTVVGEMGGTTPYSLVTTAPKVTERDIKVSTDMKALNVNIKVTPN